MSEFYRFITFSISILWAVFLIYRLYKWITWWLKEWEKAREEAKKATPSSIFSKRAMEVISDNEWVASFLLHLKYNSDKPWWLETDWVLFDSHLDYFNKLDIIDLKYWLEKFKEIRDDKSTDNQWDIINIDYIKEKIEEQKGVRLEKDYRIALVIVLIAIVWWLYYWAVDTGREEAFYTGLVVILLIIFVILWLLFTLIYDEDLSWWQKTIKYAFIVTIITAIFSWIVSMIWLPFAVITVILLGILWQLYRMNNK